MPKQRISDINPHAPSMMPCFSKAGSVTDMAKGIADPRFGLMLAKTDKDGNKLWEKTWDLSGSIEAYSVIESIDGGYTVVGTTYMVNLMTTGAWLLKVDQNGNEKWLKTYSGIGTTPIRSIR